MDDTDKPRATLEQLFRDADTREAAIALALTQCLDLPTIQRVTEFATREETRSAVRDLRRMVQDEMVAATRGEAHVDTLARALWALEIEDAIERDGQSGIPAYSTYGDRDDGIDEPCEFDEQSEELREWARWRVRRLLELANLPTDALASVGNPNIEPTVAERISMVGGKVEQTIDCGDRMWVIVRGTGSEQSNLCAIFVERTPESRSISEGDSIWWQGAHAFWTPANRAFEDRTLARLGYSTNVEGI